MHLFFSAGEPSGDIHGANCIREMRRLDPLTTISAFGGQRMREAGCQLLYPLADLAVMGFGPVVRNLPRFRALLKEADRFLRTERPDAVVLIDCPGFNWWVARRARARGIPVFYFVPPQIWGWASWRVQKMRRLVDEVFCTLSFEEKWYRDRGVPARYVGHPYFDELAAQQLNAAFVEDQQDRPGTVIGLLPGSRNQEVESNLPALLAAADYIYAARPDTRFLVACLHAHQRDRVEEALLDWALPIEAHAGRTAEIIHLAHSCVAVSGSVGLELLFRGKPAVVIYHANRVMNLIADCLMECRFFSIVNLLADRLLFPEFRGPRLPAAELGGPIVNWIASRAEYQKVCEDLANLRDKVMKPGASRLAAQAILEEASKPAGGKGRVAA